MKLKNTSAFKLLFIVLLAFPAFSKKTYLIKQSDITKSFNYCTKKVEKYKNNEKRHIELTNCIRDSVLEKMLIRGEIKDEIQKKTRSY